MRCATTLAPATLVAAGCASLQPVRLPDKELHAAIRDGSAVVPGDQIELIQTDGTCLRLEVYAVDDQALRGKTTGGPDVEVRIDDIATMDIPADTLGARVFAC